MNDLAALIRTSRRFYATHNLADWAEALPAAESFAAGPDEVDAAAGFTLALAFPPFSLQIATLERLIDETARKPAPIPDNQQYREPALSDEWSKSPNGKVLQRTDDLGGREWSPYVLWLAPAPVQKCWGLTGKQIREHFEAKEWRGLTVPEYLVLQRWAGERFGDQRFFERPEDNSEAHSLWLIDSMDDKQCAVAVGKNGVINIQAAPSGNRDRRRAAPAALVLQLL